jgi:broad-specificity NMP kinase
MNFLMKADRQNQCVQHLPLLVIFFNCMLTLLLKNLSKRGFSMYKISNLKAESIEPVTFSELGMQESDIEELLRTNIEMIADEEKSMLIVGQQVRNVHYGRSDLTAIITTETSF